MPKCQGASNNRKWRYVNGNWQCSYPPNYGDIKVNFYDLKPSFGKTDPGDPITVGFRINQSQMQQWNGPYISADGSDPRVGPVNVTSQCWNGGAGERPTGNAVNKNVTNTSVLYHGNGPVIVAMNVTKRANLNYPDKYSCLFGFQQYIATSLTGTKYEDKVQGGAVHSVDYFFSGIPASTGDSNDPISITPGKMLEMNQSDLNLYNPSLSSQEAMDGKVLSSGNGPFQNFPWYGKIKPEMNRNPLKYYCLVNGC